MEMLILATTLTSSQIQNAGNLLIMLKRLI